MAAPRTAPPAPEAADADEAKEALSGTPSPVNAVSSMKVIVGRDYERMAEGPPPEILALATFSSRAACQGVRLPIRLQ